MIAEWSKLGLGVGRQCSSPSEFKECPTDGSSPVTVSFCSTDYRAQNVTLTTSDRGDILTIDDIEPSQSLQDFNASLFGAILLSLCKNKGKILTCYRLLNQETSYHSAGLAGHGLIFGSTENTNLFKGTNWRSAFEA